MFSFCFETLTEEQKKDKNVGHNVTPNSDGFAKIVFGEKRISNSS